MKSFLHRPVYFSVVLFCFQVFFISQAKALDPPKDVKGPQSLIQSIQFDKDIIYCSKKIPLKNQDVKARLEKEMLLALWDRPQVILWVKRSGKYFAHIEPILKKYNLPADFKYVPVVESALRPHAGSQKGAVGFWQFLRSTGRKYGLRVDSRVDERRNIFKSTDAAARYLVDLKRKLGSDFLALAGYNMGEYGLKAEMKAQANSDFFSLYLPIETQRYIFKLICVKLILENPEHYGFKFDKSDIYPVFAFDRVNLKTQFQIPILLIANAAQTTFKTIKDYNPELRGYHLTKGNYSILIPQGSAGQFKNRFEKQYADVIKKYKNRVHIVKNGESLTLIAKKYNLSLSSLLKLNNFTMKKMIHPGDRLILE